MVTLKHVEECCHRHLASSNSLIAWLVADHIDVGSSAVRAVTIKIYSCIVCSVSVWSSGMTLCAEVYLPITCTTPWQTEDFSKGRVFIHNTDASFGRKFIDKSIFGKASTGIQSWLLESWLVISPAKLLCLLLYFPSIHLNSCFLHSEDLLFLIKWKERGCNSRRRE